jgi:hypothetical protein
MTAPILPLPEFLRVRCKSNKSECARRLEVSRTTLDGWLSKTVEPSRQAKTAARTKGVDLER